MRRETLAAACAALLALAGCGDSGNDTPKRAATATPDERSASAETELDANRCTPAEWDGQKTVDLDRPKTKLDPARTYVATVTTNCGAFEITLDAERAPRTGGSFKYLADEGVYDGTLIHRVVPGFVLQGGDPAGNGTGGPGYTVVERPPRDLVYEQGIVAMAKSEADEPGESGSQFFVVTGPDGEQLDPEYALLGRITGGEDVVQKIGAIITDPRTDLPDPPVVIESVRVAER